MESDNFVLRRANLADADAVAEVARYSRKHFLPYLPELHTLAEDKVFFRTVVFQENDVWLAEDEDEVVGFCAFRNGWLDHLYVLPSHVGKRLGARLLNIAKETYPHLQLWTFQKNARAISFYKREGFVKLRETDGSENEERIPDALFEWRNPVS